MTPDRRSLLPRRASSVLSVLALGTALLAGCGSVPGSTSDESIAPAQVRPETAQAWVDAWSESGEDSLSWTACEDDADAECGRLAVPRNWADPADATIEIPVRRYPSTEDEAPTLFVIQGGPGGSGTELVHDTVERVPSLREGFTLVGFDPRGVWGLQGADAPLACPGSADGCTPSDELARFASTTDVALDLEALRRALGDTPLDAVAYSYGTYVGGVYATLFPAQARRLVLDGAAPSIGFTALGTERQSIAFEESLDRFIDACLAGELGPCPVSGDGAAAKAQLIELRSVLTAHPQQVSVDGVAVTLDGARMTGELLSAMYQPRSSWPDAVTWLSEAFASSSLPAPPSATPADGESAAPRAAAPREEDAGDTAISGGFAHAVLCAMPEATTPLDRADLEPLHGDDYFFIRDSANAAEDAAEALTCETDRPAHLDPEIAASGSGRFLVTSTTQDPATPFTDAATLADQLDAVLLGVEADGHTSVLSQSTCSTRAALAYLVRGELPADGTVCTDR
ncbi:alpha/beta fold hydrolase [Microbacterium resistens]